MIIFDDVKDAFEKGMRKYENIITDTKCMIFKDSEIYGSKGADSAYGSIACGDNADYMNYMIKKAKMKGKFQIIYADPPFFSNEKYQASVRIESDKAGDSGVLKIGAYDDRWSRGVKQYLEMLTTRFLMMKDLLSDTGCLWVHLDWHMVHYVKMILDCIFGADNFVNEVIWTYKSGGANKRSFARKHDSLLFYSKCKNYKFNVQKEKSYNRDYRPYRFKGVEEFADEKGWYTMVNMKDVWNIDMVGRTSSERNGYATQKPEKLLERIIESCSEKGDLCGDFFAGSGTLGAVCEKLGRKWVMCDSSILSAVCQIERMSGAGASFRFSHDCVIKDRGKAEIEFDGDEIAVKGYHIDDKYLYEACGGDAAAAGKIKKYMTEDSPSIIRFWSVDFAYDGAVHKSDRMITGKARTCCKSDMNEGGAISVVGYDLFGNRFSESKEI